MRAFGVHCRQRRGRVCLQRAYLPIWVYGSETERDRDRDRDTDRDRVRNRDRDRDNDGVRERAVSRCIAASAVAVSACNMRTYRFGLMIHDAGLMIHGSGLMIVSDTTYSLIGFRTSTPPQNCHVDISISNGKQQVDDFAGD